MKTMFFSLLLMAQSVLASEALTTNVMDDVFKKVAEKSQEFGRQNVLLVFDIDNTILTAENDLGSDQWFSWQEKIIKEPGCAPQCITTDINKLIEAQGTLFVLGKMLPTETN